MCFAWGVADVYKWLEEVNPNVLDFWQAFDSIEPIGENWRQAAQITTIVERLIEFTAAINGSENFTPSTIDDNMPARYHREKKAKVLSDAKPQDSNLQFHSLAAAFGLSRVVLDNGRID